MLFVSTCCLAKNTNGQFLTSLCFLGQGFNGIMILLQAVHRYVVRVQIPVVGASAEMLTYLARKT